MTHETSLGVEPPGAQRRAPLIHALKFALLIELMVVSSVTLCYWLWAGRLPPTPALQSFALIFVICVTAGWLGAVTDNRWWLRLYPEIVVVARGLHLEIDKGDGLFGVPRLHGVVDGRSCELLLTKPRRSLGLHVEVVFDKGAPTQRRVPISVSTSPATSELIFESLERELGVSLPRETSRATSAASQADFDP